MMVLVAGMCILTIGSLALALIMLIQILVGK